MWPQPLVRMIEQLCYSNTGSDKIQPKVSPYEMEDKHLIFGHLRSQATLSHPKSSRMQLSLAAIYSKYLDPIKKVKLPSNGV
jgi:hypothetical protein